ncbi:MAG: DUF2059 domain-containing protein [Shimia sp.]
MRALIAAALIAGPAAADPDRLADVVGITELMPLIAAEGRTGAAELEAAFFPGRGGALWENALDEIYDPAEMEADLRAAFDTALEGLDTDKMLAFYDSPQGERIVAMELAAREAFADEAVEEAAKELARQAGEEATPLFEQVAAFIAVNDLVEANTEGALAAQYAFAVGLAEAQGQAVDSDRIAAQVWSGEGMMREETSQWLYGYLTTVFSALPDEDVEAYQAFSESDAGQQFNAAVMEAFDDLFVDLSSRLGQEVGSFSSASEL